MSTCKSGRGDGNQLGYTPYLLSACANEHSKKYASVEERKQRNREAQADFRNRRTQHIKDLEATSDRHCKEIEDMGQKNWQAVVEECVMLRYRSSLLERMLAENGKMKSHFPYHAFLTKCLGIDAQAELGIELDLVSREHVTAAHKNNSDGLSEAAAEPLNPAVRGERTSSSSDVQAQPQHSQPHPDVALDLRLRGWQIHEGQLGLFSCKR